MASWRGPDLAKLPFVEARGVEGWLLPDGALLVAPYKLRPATALGKPRPIDVRAAARRVAAAKSPSPDVVVAHWIAALRRDDTELARELWAVLSGGTDTRRYLCSALMLSWRSTWRDYEAPELALAALDALEAVAPGAADAGVARRQRAGVLATPRRIPAAPDAGLPAREAARILVQRLREQRTAASMIPGGSLPMITWTGESPAARLFRLGPDAYAALVATLEHKGLTGEYHGNMGWQEYCSYGTVAATILHRRLGFLDTPATMRRWIASGAWPDERKTLAWFAAHSGDEKIRAECARRLRDR